MSSPVRVGVGLASVIPFRRSVYHQGMTSSIHEVIFFVGSTETDDRLHADVAEMIRRERGVIPDGLADSCNVFAVDSNALVGQLVSGERVGQALVVLDRV